MDIDILSGINDLMKIYSEQRDELQEQFKNAAHLGIHSRVRDIQDELYTLQDTTLFRIEILMACHNGGYPAPQE